MKLEVSIMAIRIIRTEDDPILRKISRPVKNINNSIKTLLDDMKETLESRNGLGIAAPQVGVLKRVILVIDNDDNLIEIINPEIIESSGTQRNTEGCLSVRNIRGEVDRPEFIKVKGLDRNGNEFIIEGDKRLATVLSHETDHLEGILFTDKIVCGEYENEE
jgi:peptide deformylase